MGANSDPSMCDYKKIQVTLLKSDLFHQRFHELGTMILNVGRIAIDIAKK